MFDSLYNFDMVLIVSICGIYNVNILSNQQKDTFWFSSVQNMSF